MIMPYNDPGCARTRRRSGCCVNLITALLAGALVAVVALILGAIFATALLTALPALIVLGIVFLVLLVLSIILNLCRRNCDCE